MIAHFNWHFQLTDAIPLDKKVSTKKNVTLQWLEGKITLEEILPIKLAITFCNRTHILNTNTVLDLVSSLGYDTTAHF